MAASKESLQVCNECWCLNFSNKNRLIFKDYDYRDNNFYRVNSALLLVSCHGHLKCVEACLKRGADVNFFDSNVYPLYNAVVGNSVDCVEFLIKTVADVNMRSSDNRTVLYSAVRTGSVQCVDLLLNTGADVNVTDHRGATVLFQGEESQHPSLLKCIKRVLHEGIKVNMRSGRFLHEMTALTYFVGFLNLSPNKSATEAMHEEEFTMLLFAAGDTLDETKVKQISHQKTSAADK